MARHLSAWGIAALAVIAGCESFPGTKEERAVVLGGPGGEKLIAQNNPSLEAILGGPIGPGGGFLLGVRPDHAENKDLAKAQVAVQHAELAPATPRQAYTAATADTNRDGFITLDEVVAMKRAGFSDHEMIRRLKIADQVIALTPEQRDDLARAGLNRWVLDQITELSTTQMAAAHTP